MLEAESSILKAGHLLNSLVSVDHKLVLLPRSGPHPKSLSQRGRGTLIDFLAPLLLRRRSANALLGEGLGVRGSGDFAIY